MLVHEATNAKVSSELKSAEVVRELAVSHGHSTPEMAGSFAARVGATKLCLTHFSSRFKGDDSTESQAVMQEIADLAVEAFGSSDVVAAFDLLTVSIPKRRSQ